MSNKFGENVLTTGWFGFGTPGVNDDVSAIVRIQFGSGDPNAVAALAAPKGSLHMDVGGPFLWQSNGGTSWAKVGLQS